MQHGQVLFFYNWYFCFRTDSPGQNWIICFGWASGSSLPRNKTQGRRGIYEKALEITDSDVLKKKRKLLLKPKSWKKKGEQKATEKKAGAREGKGERKRKQLKAKEREEKKQLKAKQKEIKAKEKSIEQPEEIDEILAELNIDGECAICKKVFSEQSDEEICWVCCDSCDEWFCPAKRRGYSGWIWSTSVTTAACDFKLLFQYVTYAFSDLYSVSCLIFAVCLIIFDQRSYCTSKNAWVWKTDWICKFST